MASKRDVKAKKRIERGMKRAAKTKAREKARKQKVVLPPPTASNDAGKIAQDKLDEAMLDQNVQDVQNLLSQCKDMLTTLYNKVVKMEVFIEKIITMFTKDDMFSTAGISKLDAISKLNTEKNKIYYFKKNVVSKLVATYVQASKEKDTVEMMHSLQDFGDEYGDAMEEMQSIIDDAEALRKELMPDAIEENTTEEIEDITDVEFDHIISDNKEELYKHGFDTSSEDTQVLQEEDPEE